MLLRLLVFVLHEKFTLKDGAYLCKCTSSAQTQGMVYTHSNIVRDVINYATKHAT